MKIKLSFLLILCLLLSVSVWAETLPAPTAVTVPPESLTGNIVVSWTGVPPKGVQYEVQEAIDDGSFSGLPLAKSTKVSLKGRLAGHTYHYRLRAKLPGYEDSAWVSGDYGCDVPYVVTAKRNAGGLITVNGEGITKVTVPVGETRTVAVTPAEGFHVVSVLVDGTPLVSDSNKAAPYAYAWPSEYTFDVPEKLIDNPKNKHAISVKFAANSYKVTPSVSGSGGVITPTGEKVYKHGKGAKYTITPSAGYVIDRVLVNGEPRSGVPPTGPYSMTLVVTSDTTIEVSFATNTPKHLLTVTKAGTGSGVVVPATGTLTWEGAQGTGAYSSGALLSLTATPAEDSSFAGWAGCTSVSGSTCNVTMDAAKGVTATFALTQVAAALLDSGPFGAIMAARNGELLLPLVERDASDRATRITGALYVNTVSGDRVTVYFGADGLPEKTVFGDYILLFTNWNLSAMTVDIAKIFTPTDYIEVYKGANLNPAAVPAARSLAPATGIARGLDLSSFTPGTCFPACATDTQNLSELLKIAGLGLSVGGCAVATTVSLGAMALPCAGVIVSTAALVVGNETWLGDLGRVGDFFGAVDVFQCVLLDPGACVSVALDMSSRTLALHDLTVTDGSGLIGTANPFLTNPGQPSDVVQHGGGLPSCTGVYQCTPGGAMSYLPCYPEGVRECGADCTWSTCTETCGDGVCDSAIAGETEANCPGDCPSTPTCSGFTYSAWSTCQPDSTQTRSVLSSSPVGCTGGVPVVSQACTYVPPETICTSFTYTEWSACVDYVKRRYVTSYSPPGCTGGLPITEQGCVPACCACNFDVYCTAFGFGGCWYCNDSIYVDGVCQAPDGYLTMDGNCVCEPELYEVCR